MENKVFLVMRILEPADPTSIYSIWQFKSDAEIELKRMNKIKIGDGICIVEVELNQPSDSKII